MRCDSCREFLDLEGAKFCPNCGTTIAEPPPDPLIGQLVSKRYRIQSLLAEGGMGRVYSAEQNMGAAARKVAIKVLLSEYSGRELDMQRFSRECGTVAELEHPNTIKFYDYGETDDGDLFIAMEFLAGQSLSHVLKDGPISPERVDLIIGQICGSLQEAHDHGIIHRDLKPDNIILTSPGGQPDFVKVLDFGIAKRMGNTDTKLTPLGVVLGSPPYMSPEQFTLQDIDARSDIYSLAIVAFQSLTGKLPFQAQDPLEWAHLHMNTEPLSFDATEAGIYIPDSMRRAILRALAKDPGNRPQTMRDFFGEFTLGSGTLPPGRLPSMVPLSQDLLALAAHASVMPSGHPPRRASAMPDRRSQRPTPEPLFGKSRQRSEPPQVIAQRRDSAPQVTASPASDEAPTHVRESPFAADSNPSFASGSYADSLLAKQFETSSPALSFNDLRPSELEALGSLVDESSAERRFGKQGTVVMSASDPTPDPATGDIDKPRLTMPDLLPPTVREPHGTGVASRRATKRYLLAGAILVALGALTGLVIWIVANTSVTKPSADPGPRPNARPSKDGPLTHVEVPTSQPATTAAPQTAASAAPTAAPAASTELSPCQVAIFSALSGKCDSAQRSYARCQNDSPYRRSAERAMTGLCP